MTNESTKTVNCSCKGENENCFKCSGTGLLTIEDIFEIEHGQFLGVKVGSTKADPPPVFNTSNVNSANIKVKSKRKNKGKLLNTRVISSTIKNYEVIGINGKTRKIGKQEIKPKKKTAKSALFTQDQLLAQLNPISTLKKENRITAVRNFNENKKPIPKKVNQDKGTKKKSIGQNVSKYQDSHKIKNSMQEALEKIIDKPQHTNERNLDATKDYYKIRDNGQFGSYPSHDDFDE